MALPESFLQQLKLSCDIESIISSYVTVKRQGRNRACLCPFHSEKTPSMVIYNDTQSFYCFGCGAGGDVITFIMKIENLEYIEAVKFLADRAGLQMPETGVDDSVAKLKMRILEMNREAARFFHSCLISPIGQAGMEYLKRRQLTDETIKKFKKIDILINNAGVQYQQDSLECISDEQFDRTIKVNLYGMFYLTKEVLPYLKSGASIINLSSVTAFYGDPQLIDYVTTKAGIIGFTRALARNLATKNIRVNAIAPGFFWTPLQPACWVKEKIPALGSDAAMGRGAMPYELAPTFVFLASDDSSYVTGQVIHNNGGQVMG